MFLHLQRRSTPCSPGGSVSYQSHHVGKTKLDTIVTFCSPPLSFSLSTGIKVCLVSCPCSFRLPYKIQPQVCFSPPTPCKPNLQQDSSSSPRTAEWSVGQSEGKLGVSRDLLTAENGGSQRHSVEFYTLHLHLQQWKPGIWHTTPIPAGAQRLHTEQWNFTLKHLRPYTLRFCVLWSCCRDSRPVNLCNLPIWLLFFFPARSFVCFCMFSVP